MTRDSTEELIAELQRSESRFRTICEHAPVMIDQFDADGRCLLWNRACEKNLGYSFEEVSEAPDPLALFYPDPGERARVTDAIERADGVFREYRVRAKDGSDRLQQWADFRLPDGSQISVGHDVTEQRDTERRLRQSQKMEALGQLTSGMAHDFNNLLTIVMANAQLLERMSLPEGAQEVLGAIVDAAGQGGAMIRKLLAFSRNDDLELRPVDVSALVAGVGPTLQRLLPDSIRVQLSTRPSLPRVKADDGAMEQILLNLATNARDAMPHGGTFTVSVAERWVGEEEGSTLQCDVGDYVEVVVRDDGTGIAHDDLPRVFEPFFTTKETGGTGLGLPMVYGLMRQQGGAVHIDSEVGRGTEVRLLLPMAERKPRAAVAESAHPAAPRVLVVEDLAPIRRVLTLMLSQADYAVEEVPDGARALARLREDPGFDLVICDLAMPKMGGAELYREVSAFPQAPPFLFITGYATDETLAELGADSTVAILRKPFQMDQLLEAARQALQAPERAVSSG